MTLSQAAELGDSNDSVVFVQQYLHQYGYKPNVTNVMGTFDDTTTESLAVFQAFYGLPISGKLDAATARIMELPRCANADVSGEGTTVADSACKMQRGSHLYSVGRARGINRKLIEDAVEAAFIEWEQFLYEMNFSLDRGLDPLTRIKIEWVPAAHGDIITFSGSDLAHAFDPMPCGGGRSGHIHMWDQVDWTVNLALSPDGFFDVQTVVLHEIGHILGFGHVGDENSVMHSPYTGARRELSPLDQDKIKVRYPFK